MAKRNLPTYYMFLNIKTRPDILWLEIKRTNIVFLSSFKARMYFSVLFNSVYQWSPKRVISFPDYLCFPNVWLKWKNTNQPSQTSFDSLVTNYEIVSQRKKNKRALKDNFCLLSMFTSSKCGLWRQLFFMLKCDFL